MRGRSEFEVWRERVHKCVFSQVDSEESDDDDGADGDKVCRSEFCHRFGLSSDCDRYEGSIRTSYHRECELDRDLLP